MRSVGSSSVSIDAGGRLLVSFDSTTHRYGSSYDTFTNHLVRLSGDGRPDPKFKGGDFDSSLLRPDGFAHSSAAITRTDGNIAVLLDNEVLIAGARGQLSVTNGQKVVLPTLVPGFQPFAVGDGSVVVTADNKVIIGGAVFEGTRKPVLIRLNADLTLDTTFGSDGILRLPVIAGVSEPEGLTLNADGTLNAILRAPTFTQLVDQVPVVRVFADDRPVASLRGISRKGDQIRLTVSVRGIDPIDVASLGSDDFRIRAVGPGGGGVPGLITLTDAGNGDALLTLGVNRPRGTYDVVTLSKRVSDDDGDFVRAGTFATITI